jgi:hypothetical protein
MRKRTIVFHATAILCMVGVASAGVIPGTGMSGSSIVAKTKFDFDNLPGRNSPVRSLEDFGLSAILVQHGLKVSQALEEPFLGRGLVSQHMARPRGTPERPDPNTPVEDIVRPVYARVYVGGGIRDAREMLFVELSEGYLSVRMADYLTEVTKSDSPGDFCLLTTTRLRVQTIRFARGNIAVSVSADKDMERSALLALARDIDAAIQKQPVVSDEQKKALLPTPEARILTPSPVLAGAHKAGQAELEVKGAPKPENQRVNVVVISDAGPAGTFDGKTGRAVCSLRFAGGVRRIGIGFVDTVMKLSAWTVKEIEVQEDPKDALPK